MKINKTNYELWFIDYLDGKLDSDAGKELDAFLKANPDLANELNSFEEIRLEPAEVNFVDRNKLEKTEADVMGIDASDYLLIKQMEEGLSKAEEITLSDSVKQDGSLIRREREFQKTNLLSDHIVFPAKSSLLRKNFKPVYVLLSKAGFAAAVLGLIFIGWELLQTNDNSYRAITLIPLESSDIEVFSIDEISMQLATSSPSNYSIEKELENAVESVNPGLHGGMKKERSEQKNALSGQPFRPLEVHLSKNVRLPVELPNAYETGLRHMMPLYLDLNNERKQLFAFEDAENKKPQEDGLFIKGLRFVDKVSGDLVNFDRMYDNEGNYVAYNLKTGGFEMERKVRR